MRMYVVPKIGSGTEDDPYRPDISDDVPWTGVPAAVGNVFIIFTDHDLPGKAPVAPANKAATLQARGLAATLFDTWFVGA